MKLGRPPNGAHTMSMWAIRMDDALQARIKLAAALRNRTASDYARTILDADARRTIERHEKKQAAPE